MNWDADRQRTAGPAGWVEDGGVASSLLWFENRWRRVRNVMVAISKHTVSHRTPHDFLAVTRIAATAVMCSNV